MMITLPEAFKKRMKELFKDEYEAFEASYEKERVQGLRFNSLKSVEGRKTGWEKKLYRAGRLNGEPAGNFSYADSLGEGGVLL